MSATSEIETIIGFIADIESAGIAGDVVSLVKVVTGFIETSGASVTAAQLAVLKSYDGTKTVSDYLIAAQQAAAGTQSAPVPTPAAS